MDGRNDRLDLAFGALGDPVRRAIVARLSRGSATVNELAEPFPISLQAISRHVGVLEAAGLITRSRQAQQRPCHLDAAALDELTGWLDRLRIDTERNHRQLDTLLQTVRDTP